MRILLRWKWIMWILHAFFYQKEECETLLESLVKTLHCQRQSYIYLKLSNIYSALIKHFLKSCDHSQSLLKQLDDPKTQPKSKSSPNFCTDLCKIQTCIPVFCDLHSVINWKWQYCVCKGPFLLINFEPSNLFYCK